MRPLAVLGLVLTLALAALSTACGPSGYPEENPRKAPGTVDPPAGVTEDAPADAPPAEGGG